jgi:putative membrane protein
MDLTFYLQTFDHFLIYLVVSLVLFLIGTYIFKLLTPYSEREQIRKGNTAVALKLLGKMAGLVVVLQSAIRHSINLVDLAIWAFIAIIVQIVLHLVIEYVFTRNTSLAKEVENGNVAVGLFLGGVSILVGLIVAATISY